LTRSTGPLGSDNATPCCLSWFYNPARVPEIIRLRVADVLVDRAHAVTQYKNGMVKLPIRTLRINECRGIPIALRASRRRYKAVLMTVGLGSFV
jgi:hypothetical protein